MGSAPGCAAGPTAASSPLPPLRCCSYLDIIEQAVSEGHTLLIENIGETVEPVLDPLLGRNTIKKGKYVAPSRPPARPRGDSLARLALFSGPWS